MPLRRALEGQQVVIATDVLVHRWASLRGQTRIDLLDRIDPTAKNILEFGCGDGRDAAAMEARGFEVDAIDGDLKRLRALEKAQAAEREAAEAAEAAVRQAQVDLQRLRFAGAVLGKIAILVLIILFIQKRPRGMFALKGRAVEA